MSRMKQLVCRTLHRARITYPVRNAAFSLLKRFVTFDAVKSYPDGLRLCLDLSDYVGYRIWQRGFWEKHVLRAICDHLRPGGVFVDVGAHCGFDSAFVAHAFQDDVRVVAFEPNLRVSRLLRESIELNGFVNLTLDERAVSDHEGAIEFYVEPEGNAGQSGLLRRRGARRRIMVEGVTLGRALREHSVDHVDVLKLDVEGAEAVILPNILESSLSLGAIVLEVHSDAIASLGSDPMALIALLRKNGYDVAELAPEGLRSLRPERVHHVIARRGGVNPEIPFPRRSRVWGQGDA
jgi:FkbM family methyltransferase